jgi:predicted Zn-dependent peptidase
MSIYADSDRDEIAELVPVLYDELTKVWDTVTADEIERTERSANQILDYGRTIPVSETMAKIDTVTSESVMAVAERIFRSRPAVAAVGRLDKLETYDTLAAGLA